ncbi:MAG: hypothetical protein ACR2KV_08870 [Solirubrobacteraceae bacterium]
MILALTCFQRLARFPRFDELPGTVVEHVRRCLELYAAVSPRTTLTARSGRIASSCGPGKA